MTITLMAENALQEELPQHTISQLPEKDFFSIATLLCGNRNTSNSDIDEILNHLFDSIGKICQEITKLESMPDDHITLYGPFLGRSLLELGSTALIARIDPFRVLILREAQKQSNYNLGTPHSASIRWQGDVLAENVDQLWADKSLKNPTRALLGVYQRHFFSKIMDDVIDELNNSGNGDWTNRLTSRQPEGLAHYIMQEITTLYSSLSKGIHHELIVPAATLLDRVTLITLLNKALHVMATMGLFTSFVPHIYNKIDNKSTLVENFNKSEILEIN